MNVALLEAQPAQRHRMPAAHHHTDPSMTPLPKRILHQLIAAIGLTLLCTAAPAADDPTLQGGRVR